MAATYQGIITKFLVKKQNWGLAIFYKLGEEKLKIKIKGNISAMEMRQSYEIVGELEHHQKYGPVFQVQSFHPIVSSSKRKDATATNRKSFVETIFQQSNLNWEIYQKLKALTLDEIHLTSLLENGFLTWSYSQKLGSLGDLDAIALKFGTLEDSDERIGHWLTYYADQILRKSGNTYTDLSTLLTTISREWEKWDTECLTRGLLYAKEKKWLYLVNHKIYTQESWTDENDIIQSLHDLNQEVNPLFQGRIETLIKKTEEEVAQLLGIKNFQFDAYQWNCLEQLARNSVLIISGGPGTGKSTLILGLAVLFRHLFPQAPINITTPTGRASIRLKSIIPEFNPMTLHRLLEFDENEFHRTGQNPLQSKLVIIDEMSMVDNHLFASFLRAAPNLSKLVLVGDKNQLPPVNYGDIFNDLISSQKFTTCYVAYNHRQTKNNGIIKLATAIQENSLNKIDWAKLRHVEFISGEDLSNLLTLKLDYSRYCVRSDFDVTSYQIIAPIYRGVGGIHQINQLFQQEFNPFIKDSAKIFCQNQNNFYTINDKIICNKNLPEYDLANGEVGIIKELEIKNQELVRGMADFGGRNIPLSKEIFQSLSLCYACSIHKTQGSEYQKVALILADHMKPNSFLNKKLIYTAITRAKKELLIIGKRELFIQIASQEATPRLSTILDKINNSSPN